MRKKTHEAILRNALAEKDRAHEQAFETMRQEHAVARDLLQRKIAELEVLMMACARRAGSRATLPDDLLEDTGRRFRYTVARTSPNARKQGVVLSVGIPVPPSEPPPGPASPPDPKQGEVA